METLRAEKKIQQRTLAFAWFVSVFVALLLPSSIFLFGYQSIKTTNSIEAEIAAERISELITNYPDLWMYLDERVFDKFSQRLLREDRDILVKVYERESEELFAYGSAVSLPSLTVGSDIYNAGILSGRVEIVSSLTPLYIKTAVSFLLGLIFAIGMFVFMRRVPLRALEESIDLLIAEKQRLEVIFRSIGEGVFTTDVRGKILLCNRDFIELVEYPREKLQQLTVDELIEEITGNNSGKQYEIHARVVGDKKPVTVFHAEKITTRSGEVKTISLTASPLFNDEEITGSVYVMKDFTEMLKSQEKISRIAQLENLGVLAGGIAHDFNNFLSTLMANFSVIKDIVPTTDEANTIIKSSEESILRARDLSEKLITFSQGGELQLETVDVRGILKEECEFMLSGSNVEGRFNFDEKLWGADIDVVQFSQLVQNMTVNAIQAMRDGGIFQISAKNKRLENSENPFQLPPGPYIEVVFEDTGVGIPPENVSKIFMPFYSNKDGGSGLGLAVSDSVVRRHAGDISVSSKPGKGTRFTIILPAAPDKLLLSDLEEAEKVFQRTYQQGDARVLIMDDNVELVNSLTKVFVRRGYEVIHAEEGSRAIELYQEAHGSSTPIDLLILDITIPGGMGGKEAITGLINVDPDVKAIVASGYSKDPVMANYEKYGFKGALRKPFRIDQVLGMVERILAE